MRAVSRNLNILDYAASLLVRKKYKNGGVLLVFAAVIFLLSSLQLTATALRSVADEILTTVPDITVQQMSAGRQVALEADYQQAFQRIFGIREVRERVWGYYFDEKNGANYTIIGLAPENVSADMQAALAWGRLPENSGEVVMATPVAENMQLGERRSFSLFRPDLSMQSFTLVGVFRKDTGILTNDMMLMSQTDASELFDIAYGQITDLLIEVANPREVDNIAGKISDVLPGTRVLTKTQIQKTYDVVFTWRSGFGSICLLTSLFAFIILAWDKASGFSPDERKEMAILKVVGWQTRDIMLLRFWESAFVGLLAFLGGYSLAWLHVAFFDAALLQPVMLGWSVLRPTPSLFPPFQLTDFVLIGVFSIIPYMAATIVPAWKSGMVRPDSVI